MRVQARRSNDHMTSHATIMPGLGTGDRGYGDPSSASWSGKFPGEVGRGSLGMSSHGLGADDDRVTKRRKIPHLSFNGFHGRSNHPTQQRSATRSRGRPGHALGSLRLLFRPNLGAGIRGKGSREATSKDFYLYFTNVSLGNIQITKITKGKVIYIKYIRSRNHKIKINI